MQHKHFSSSQTDLYNPLPIPPALLKVHQKLDAAVDAAYQPSGGKKTYASDVKRVAFLFELYQRITSLLPVSVIKKYARARALKRLKKFDQEYINIRSNQT